MKFLGNILWLVLGGLIVSLYYFIVGVLICLTIIGIPFGLQLIEIALFHVTIGAILCLTIVGIPFGLQHFKMALLALVPFGKQIS